LGQTVDYSTDYVEDADSYFSGGVHSWEHTLCLILQRNATQLVSNVFPRVKLIKDDIVVYDSIIYNNYVNIRNISDIIKYCVGEEYTLIFSFGENVLCLESEEQDLKDTVLSRLTAK